MINHSTAPETFGHSSFIGAGVTFLKRQFALKWTNVLLTLMVTRVFGIH